MFRDLRNFAFKHADCNWVCFVRKVFSLTAGNLKGVISEVDTPHMQSLDADIPVQSSDAIMNKDIISERYSSNKLRGNLVYLLSKIIFLDNILHSDIYAHFPSYFQKPYFMSVLPKNSTMWSIRLKFPIHHIDTFLPYDTPLTTMPMLSEDLETVISIREELLRFYIIPELRSELSLDGLEDWRALTRLLDVLATTGDSRFGALYDVVTEHFGRSYRSFELLHNSSLELSTVNDLMRHHSHLLEEGGFLNYSDEESESNGSSESESNSSQNN